MSLTLPDIAEFAAALSRSIECMDRSYPNDNRLLEWTRELLFDATAIAGEKHSDLLKREIWSRLPPSIKQQLYKLAADRPSLQDKSPIDLPTPRRQKAAA